MPNTHFGEIGDVWKHLPLATLLSLEQPSQYWETHSGSPVYPLLNSQNTQLLNEVLPRWWKIEFGVVHYFRSSINQTALQQSFYTSFLKKYATSDLTSKCPLTHTLGSTAIAVFSLRSPSKFVFCDIILDDLTSIREYSQHWIPNFDNEYEA
jgi:23S rRNA A2030 N6-methylase RlmJ